MSIQSISKAIAGAAVTAITAYLVKRGIVLDPSISEAVTYLIAAGIGFVGVYFAPKNKEEK